MKIFRILWAAIRTFALRISLAQFGLACLLGILLVQSSCSLFLASPADSTLQHDIDIIIRTASASIFGYFLSSPLKDAQLQAGSSAVRTAPQQLLQQKVSTAAPKERAKIGFSAGDEDLSNPTPPSFNVSPRSSTAENIPILAATAIALFCLLTLMLLRSIGAHQTAEPTSVLATVAQFRDFISGCIGFLIGCARPTHSSQLQQED